MSNRWAAAASFMAVLAAEATSQKASFTIFGKGKECQPLDPHFSAEGRPILGKSMRILSSQPWKGQGATFLATGFSNTKFGSLRLPFFTPVLNTPDTRWCGSLLVSVDSMVKMGFATTNYNGVVLHIPNDRRLIGRRLYHQALLWHWKIRFAPHRFDWSLGGISVIGTF